MRDILVPLTTLHSRTGNVAYAAALAKRCDAALTGLYALPVYTGLPDVPSPMLLAEAVEIAAECRRTALDAGPTFARWAQAYGLGRAGWHVAQGWPPQVVARAACWHDLVVLERHTVTEWGSVGCLGEQLLSIDAPCIVVPERVESPPPERIALAWNGSVEALRAIRAALPLLDRASEIVLLHAQTGQSRADDPDIGAWLERHGYAVTHCTDAIPEARAGAALLEAATAARADLLVMGAYGHSRLREWVLGGATRHVLDHMTLPVLMAH